MKHTKNLYLPIAVLLSNTAKKIKKVNLGVLLYFASNHGNNNRFLAKTTLNK